MRDVADQRAQPQRADQRQHHAGHQHCQQQALDAKAGDGGRHQNNEGAGRAADLKPAAAERRNDEAADNRCVEPAVRRNAGRDRDRHRKRQRDDGDRQRGERVLPEGRKDVALGEGRRELRAKKMGGCGTVGHGGQGADERDESAE
jgi:hypothetical protein